MMRKQNVVVANTGAIATKSALDVEITVSVSPGGSMDGERLTLPAPSRKPPAPCGFIKVSRRKDLKMMEIERGRVVNAWVDSMRASSPTQLRPSSVSVSVADENEASWMIRHPSALSKFDQIARSSKGKRVVVFLDYDGTLSPIVDDPDQAFMSEEMRTAVRNVAKCFPTAIVSGRCKDKVYGFVRLSQLYYAGSHGMDIEGPKHERGKKAVVFQPASQFLPMIDEVYKALEKKTESTPGAKVENNKFCVSVHFRCVEEKRWSELAEQVRSVLKEYPKLKMTQGRKVLEIRPMIKWDKGKALEFLLESLGFANCRDVLPVYIGDDRTDEDAFKVLRERGQGFGILVSKTPKDTNASYSLKDPSEVMSFLERLVDLKSL